MPTNAIVGDPGESVEALEALAAATGADELMVHTSTFGLAERIASLELLADAWGRRFSNGDEAGTGTGAATAATAAGAGAA